MAGIIKASGSPSSHVTAGSTTFQLDDIERSYLTRVRAEAQTIVQNARDEAAKIRSQAAEQGKQAAIQAAEAALKSRVDQQLQSLLPALQQAVKELVEARHLWQQHWESHSLKLAAAIASKLVRRELSVDPQLPLTLVRDALQMVVGADRVTIRLNPEDHAVLSESASRLAQQLRPISACDVIADPQIERGGCRVETQLGSIDQQFGSQLDRIMEELS